MLIQRWEAQTAIDLKLAKLLFENEGLEFIEENFPAQYRIPDHRHSMTEVRQIIKGELLVRVGGNQLLLREGDRIEIPANTKHSYHNNLEAGDCLSLTAYKIS